MLCHLLQKIAVKGWRVVLSTDATSCVVKSDDRKDHPQVGYHENWYHDSSVNIFILGHCIPMTTRNSGLRRGLMLYEGPSRHFWTT